MAISLAHHHMTDEHNSNTNRNGKRTPPGPKGLPMTGIALKFMRNPLGTLEWMARTYGDMVTLRIGRQSRLLLNHPDLIEQILVIQQAKFHKSTITKAVTGRLLGQGLLISEGDFWRRQRRLAQPAFQRTRINCTRARWSSAPKPALRTGATAKSATSRRR